MDTDTVEGIVIDGVVCNYVEDRDADGNSEVVIVYVVSGDLVFVTMVFDNNSLAFIIVYFVPIYDVCTGSVEEYTISLCLSGSVEVS
ncbi:MAG: hypothetical protein A4E25_01444 [Methanobacterium sp. PtaB.Bin024]|nr:MAG: hypothetical protein A4E25_01444 [Methanobacterium sp. PtaB.Bin024]